MHRIAIGIPSTDGWNVEFGLSLARLLIFCGRMPFADRPVDVVLSYATSAVLPTSRNRILANAIAEKAEHLLMLDCDMAFPPDTLHRLLSHGRDVVAANYVKRTFPAVPVAHRDGRRVISSPEKHGLEAVDGTGAGVMLVRLAALMRIEPPAFAYAPIPGDPIRVIGEDTYFCRKLTEAGIPVLIDHDLSRDVAHIGSFAYRMEHAAEGRPS